MAEFSKLVTTKKGQALIAKNWAGTAERPSFTKIAASQQALKVEDLEELTALDIVQEAEVSRVTRTNEVAVMVETAFSNKDLTTGYHMRVLGLYALDPDEGEILYSAAVELSGNDWMPPYNGVTVTGAYIQLITTVGNSEDVSLMVNPAALATIADINRLQEQIDEINSFLGVGDLTHGHPSLSVIGEAGVHGLRYWNDQFQVKIPSGTGEDVWATANGGGGGGSAIGPQIFVTVDAGSAVTCSDGVTELSAVAGDDPVIFSLPNYGTWTVTGTLGDQTDTEVLEVDTAKRYNVALAYFSATLNITTKAGAAVIATNGTKSLTGTAGEDGALSFNIASPGTWTVRASAEGVESNRETVEIDTEGETYEATLSFITVTITADPGSTVTCTDGTTTRSGVSVGAMTFYLPNTGVWQITATKDGQTASETLTVGSYAPYTVTLNYYKYVGVKVTISNNNTESAVSYVEDAVGMATGFAAWKDYNIFKNIRPCVVKNGMVQYYLNPDDFSQKVNGGAATINSETAGDVMIEIPKLGYKMTTDGSTHTIMVTDDPNAPGYCYRAHGLDAEGDCDAIYIGAYLATNISSKLYSLSGKSPTTDITLTNARTYAQARGAGYQLVSFYPLTLLQCLYLIMFKNRNGQAALGKGYTSASAKINTGGTNAKGMCYGETGGKQQMCFLGIEDFWGNLFWWIDGIFCDNSRNVKTAFKDFKDDGSSYPFTKASGLSQNLGGWIGDIQGTNEGGFTIKTSTGSATSHWADYAYLCAGCCASFGGYWNYGDDAGPFRFYVYSAASSSGSSLGARLMYKKKAA